MSKQEKPIEQNILREYSVKVGLVTAHYTEYVNFIPKQMIEETRVNVGVKKDQYASKAHSKDTTILFSITEPNPKTLLYMVSLDGPDEEHKETIIGQFQDIFGLELEIFPWKSVVFTGQENNMYVWTAIRVD